MKIWQCAAVTATLVALILWLGTDTPKTQNGAITPQSDASMQMLEAHGYVCQRQGGQYQCR